MARSTDRLPFAGARWAKGMDPAESRTRIATAVREAARGERDDGDRQAAAHRPGLSTGLDARALKRESRRRRAEREALERESRPGRLEREAVQRMASRQAEREAAPSPRAPSREPLSPVAAPPAFTERRPTDAVPAVEFTNVSKVYDGGIVGLERVNLSIGRGEFIFLVGATGCGKSTFVRLLLRELAPSTGRVLISGHDLGQMPGRKVPKLRRNIGTIFQDYKLLPNRTVYDNVAYSLQVIGESRKSIHAKVPDILRLVGLSTKLRAFPDELSGGEQQRVSIARAFVNHPPLLLADEPTGNLDPETSIGIMQLIYRINRTGTTVVVATHDREMVDKMRRRVVELRHGRVIRDQDSGLYRALDESTMELGVRLRGELGVGVEGHPN